MPIEWAAPVILASELRNVLLGYMRRGVLTADQAKGMSDDAAAVLRGRTATVAAARRWTRRWSAT